MTSLADLRRHYARETLDEREVHADPIEQFLRWFEQAQRAEAREPNAMTVATVSATGQPSARTVLLKGVDERGFTFFTDYRSRKAAELDGAGRAGLCFWWGELERQVRVIGQTERVSREESAAYFATRPRGSQLGAWTSRQSSVLSSRDDLDAQLSAVVARFGEGEVSIPDHWGGYRVRPDEIEFWQGRADRLHDRVMYQRAQQEWVITRLSP